jgi:hypothetical protein
MKYSTIESFTEPFLPEDESLISSLEEKLRDSSKRNNLGRLGHALC